jgi:CRP/FNR family cyclic AMP-dependent transcriptional regulator
MAKAQGDLMQDDRPAEFRVRLQEMLDSHGLSADLASEIENHLTPVTYEKGAVIFLRGSPADLLFWLLKGFVKLYLPLNDGSRTLVDLARAGDFLAFVNDESSQGRRQLLEAQALTKCSVGLFTRENLMRLLSRLDHSTAIRLLEQLNTAWSRVFERYIIFLGSSFRVRLEMVLERLGARFGIEDERGTLLVPELGHEDLAEMIGSSRPMVSKLIGEMTEEGLLTRGDNRRFILCAKTRLSAAPTDALQPSVRSNGASKQVAGARVPLLTTARGNPQGSFSRAAPTDVLPPSVRSKQAAGARAPVLATAARGNPQGSFSRP